MPACRDWTIAPTPTQVQLNAVVAAGSRCYAVGNRGLMLERRESGWERILDTGLTNDGRGLLDVAATDDGRRLWCCGVRGELGYYDRRTGAVGRIVQPYDLVSNFRQLAVGGAAGQERLHVADDDGRVVRLTLSDDEATVLGVAVPGPNEPVTAAFDIGDQLFAADTSGRLYRSTDGRRWQAHRLVSSVVTGLAVDADGLLAVTRGGGAYSGIRDFRELPDRVEQLPDGVRPHDVDGAGEGAAIVGSGGNLLLREANDRFERVSVGTTAGLSGVALREDGTVLAVGMDGTVVEGHPRG
jgi:sugar lactone lactonase YvrE